MYSIVNIVSSHFDIPISTAVSSYKSHKENLAQCTNSTALARMLMHVSESHMLYIGGGGASNLKMSRLDVAYWGGGNLI